MNETNPIRSLLLYIPFLLSWATAANPHFSYLVAWGGSFFIFYFALSGRIKKLPTDLTTLEQMLRPIYLLHIIFAGYMCCTSIFYYVNALGYQYFEYLGPNFSVDRDIFKDIATCQRYYVLGHAALVTGIVSRMKYPVRTEFKLYTPSMSNLLLAMSIVCLPLGYVLSRVSALSQFSLQLDGLSFVTGTIALAFAIKEQKRINLYISLGLFGANFLKALSSGFKEPIIVCVLLLGVFLLPVYGKKVVPLFGLLIVGLLFVLPTFIGNFRTAASASHGHDLTAARDQSIDAIINDENLSESLKKDNWSFLIIRFSEIDMFIKYTKSTPTFVPYYKLNTVINATKSIVPRFLWPWKPDMETLVMERAYKANVVDRSTAVSAKPAFVVDCYLSYGIIGIWVGLFLYGYFAQWLSQKAEALFGGYFMGTAVIFTGLFQIFWRGNSLEILFNAVFWSFITMYIISEILRSRGILERAKN